MEKLTTFQHCAGYIKQPYLLFRARGAEGGFERYKAGSVDKSVKKWKQLQT